MLKSHKLKETKWWTDYIVDVGEHYVEDGTQEKAF